ncbi:hypothetical protein HDU99_003992, partial [Rhizoclosmatium hyalinum]
VTPVYVAAPEQEDMNEYELQQVSLFEMGFVNTALNVELLRAYKGDLVAVSEQLVLRAEHEEAVSIAEQEKEFSRGFDDNEDDEDSVFGDLY